MRQRNFFLSIIKARLIYQYRQLLRLEILKFHNRNNTKSYQRNRVTKQCQRAFPRNVLLPHVPYIKPKINYWDKPSIGVKLALRRAAHVALYLRHAQLMCRVRNTNKRRHAQLPRPRRASPGSFQLNCSISCQLDAKWRLRCRKRLSGWVALPNEDNYS